MSLVFPFSFFISSIPSASTFDTIYGGIDLIGRGTLKYMNDYLGNSRWCKMDGWDNRVDSTDSNLLFPQTADHSGCAWVYYPDWTTGGTSGGVDMIVRYNAYSGNGWGSSRNNTYLRNIANGVEDNNVLHGLTGSGWHFVAWTRDVTGTTTKLYLDSAEIDSDSVASSYTTPVQFVLLFVADGAITDVWIQKDVIWSGTNIQDLYDVYSVEGRYLAETDFPSTTNLYGWRAKAV